MSRNSHNPRGSSTYARNQTSRWRSGILMLVLALSIGSWRQPAQAQEADPDVRVRTVLNANIPPDICVNEIGTVEVKVIRRLTEIATNWVVPFELGGIVIDATSGDSDIASLINTHSVTGFGSAGEDSLATFDYRGEKDGTTNLKFKAREGLKLITGEDFDRDGIAQVTVNECKIKVNVTSNFPSTGGRVKGTVTGKISEADLLPTGTKGSYEGTADVKWSGTLSKSWDCAGELAGKSKAHLKGTLGDRGQLRVNIQYDSFKLEMKEKCAGELVGGMPFPASASPIGITVNLETGGGSSPSQTLSTLYQMSGTAFIEVWQVKSE